MVLKGPRTAWGHFRRGLQSLGASTLRGQAFVLSDTPVFFCRDCIVSLLWPCLGNSGQLSNIEPRMS